MPSTNMIGTASSVATYTGIPALAVITYTRYIASVSIAPWAKFTMPSTPKIRVRPMDTRA